MNVKKTMKLAIGVDLGGTKMRVAVVDEAGKVLEQMTVPTDVAGGAEGIITSLVSIIGKLQSQLGERSLEAVGVAIAGQVDGTTGNVKFAPNLFWQDVPLGSRLFHELKVPVVVVNDVRAATWGEMCFGAGRGIQDLVCLFIGTGIGGGVVSKGTLMEGHNNSAGEIGHMVICCGGPRCNCGNQGCWEALAGGRAIGKSTKEAIEKEPDKGAKILSYASGDIEKVVASHLFQAAHEGDPFAIKLVQKIEEALVAGTTNVVNAFNPECIIFGGGIIESTPWLIKRIEKGVREHALKSAVEKLKVVQAQCGGDAGVLGVAAMALKKVNEGVKSCR